MTEEYKQDLIEAYHRGRLSETEKIIFDDLILNDANFSSDVKIYTTIYKGFDNLEFEYISHQIQEWEKKYTEVVSEKSNLGYSNEPALNNNATKKIQFLRIISFAAAFLGIILLTYFLLNLQHKDLYVQFFEEPELYLQVRGKELSQNEKERYDALNLYQEKKYAEAAEKLSKFSNNFPEDWEILYFLAVSKMKINQFDSAILDFDKILKNNNNAFIEGAEWMTVLSFYKTGNEELLSFHLNRILEKKDHFYYQKALKFKELNK